MSETSDRSGQVLSRLFAVIESRRTADPKDSYVATLLHSGASGIAQKVGEEAIETIVAATAGDVPGTVHESADLMFHLMVLWAHLGITPGDVLDELERREGISGHTEKQNRP